MGESLLISLPAIVTKRENNAASVGLSHLSIVSVSLSVYFGRQNLKQASIRYGYLAILLSTTP